MDFLRTPGFSGYTFGLGVPDGYTGPLVSQADTWSMERTGVTITAQLGSVLLSGDISAASSCHSIVITGSFSRKLAFFSPPDHISVSMYIDGAQVDSYDMDGALEIEDPTVPTLIGDPYATANMGTLGEPVILNVAIDSDSQWSVEDFSQALCAQP